MLSEVVAPWLRFRGPEYFSQSTLFQFLIVHKVCQFYLFLHVPCLDLCVSLRSPCHAFFRAQGLGSGVPEWCSGGSGLNALLKTFMGIKALLFWGLGSRLWEFNLRRNSKPEMEATLPVVEGMEVPCISH